MKMKEKRSFTEKIKKVTLSKIILLEINKRKVNEK
jgi:hypothetical protein